MSKVKPEANQQKNNHISKDACNSIIGVKMVGELAAKFWLLQNHANKEGEDVEEIYEDDKN